MFVIRGAWAVIKNILYSFIIFTLFTVCLLVLNFFYEFELIRKEDGNLNYEENFNKLLDYISTAIIDGATHIFLVWAPQYMSSNPGRTITSAVVMAALIVSGLICWRYKINPLTSFSKLKARRNMIHKIGVSAYWESARLPDRRGEWDELSRRIQEAPQGQVNILGAGGWETFGENEGVIEEAIRNFQGHMRIILLNPDSAYLADRAASLGVRKDSYKKLITQSIKYLEQLSSKGGNIELRLYNYPPNWKMIITPKTLWLQQYTPGCHVIESPVYMFYGTKERTGMFYLFLNDFERIWKISKPVANWQEENEKK